MASDIVVAHDLVVAMDYGYFLLRGGAPEFPGDDVDLLNEAVGNGQGVAANGNTVVVCSPHQNNFAMPLRVEVWTGVPVDDLDQWDEAFEADLTVGEDGALSFSSPTLAGSTCTVSPGRYRALITGHGFAANGSVTPGDSWRVRLWPTGERYGPRRLRKWRTSWTPLPAAPVPATGAHEWSASMRAELLALPPGDECCRRAEAATLLRLLPAADRDIQRRLETLLGEKVADPDLRTTLGLVNGAGVPVSGLPPRVVAAERHCGAAAWRGALVARGSLTADGQRSLLVVDCPNPQMALGLLGAARRLGFSDVRLRESPDRVLVRDAPAALRILGASGTAAALPAAQTGPPR